MANLSESVESLTLASTTYAQPSHLRGNASDTFLIDFTLGLSIAVITVCGNSLIIAACGFYDKFDSIFPAAIVNLALADFLNGVMCCVTFSYLGSQYFNSFTSVSACNMLNVGRMFTESLTTCAVSLITLERYVAIHHPFVYSAHMRVGTKLTYILLAYPWLGAALVSATSAAFISDSYIPDTFCTHSPLFTNNFDYLIAAMLVVMSSTMILMN